MTSPPALRPNICGASAHTQHQDAPGQPADAHHDAAPADTDEGEEDVPLSRLEVIVSTYPPVLESLLAQLPTRAVLDLYHTSRYLRGFLRQYPLAWKTLSFRLPPPAAPTESPATDRDRLSKAYGFESLLYHVILPYGTRLTSLDLCNTSVSGIALITNVLTPRIGCLQHLSVRGCKSVSLKYHIVPFFEPYTVEGSPWNSKDIALKSLYTYRCRHHRRRPYLPSSLARRDSDADPTHQLIEICHRLGIWTDTAWCPTPAGRCQRRKEYHDQRGGTLNREIWVPFDRLWRSCNRFGPAEAGNKSDVNDGRLWETSETGQDGEALGTADGNGTCRGEGKQVPAHQRRSHTLFVEDVRCAQCNEAVLERCESCSIRMHCMGCRKTLCESCAFNRPTPRKRAKTRHFASSYFGSNSTLGSALSHATGSTASGLNSQTDEESDTVTFWWAPGATRSPNLMKESLTDDDSSDSDDAGGILIDNGLPGMPAVRNMPKLIMKWCCVEPIISGGGGVNVVGSSSGTSAPGASRIRAVPLPRKKQYLDPDFTSAFVPLDPSAPFPFFRELKPNGTYEFYPVMDQDVDILALLQQEAADMEMQARNCPRSLCNDCYRGWRWKVTCRACKTPLCKEHDLRSLKFRKCGFRDVSVEREYVRAYREREKEAPPMRLVIPEFKPRGGASKSGGPGGLDGQAVQEDAETEAADVLSQSQILLPMHAQQNRPSNVGASSSSTPISGIIPGPSANATAMPSRPLADWPSSGPSRPRSFSASGLRSNRSPHPNSLLAWSKASKEPSVANSLSSGWLSAGALPCGPRHPVQFEGCGAFFCQYPRPIGDNRPSCPAEIKECTDCRVQVCETCVTANPTCPCTYCTTHYYCPFCALKPANGILCRLEEELAIKAAAMKREEERREREKDERSWADGVAEGAKEFWTLVGGLPGYEDDEQAWRSMDGAGGSGGGGGAEEFGVDEQAGISTTVAPASPVISDPGPVYHEDIADAGAELHLQSLTAGSSTQEAHHTTPALPQRQLSTIIIADEPQHENAQAVAASASTSAAAAALHEPETENENDNDSEDIESSDAPGDDEEENELANAELADAEGDTWDSDTERALANENDIAAMEDAEFFA